MGAGIAHTCARAEYNTLVSDVSQDHLQAGIERIFRFIDRGIERGKIEASEKRTVEEYLHGTLNLQEYSDCDLIIEAVPEQLEIKQDIFLKLDTIAAAYTIFATNTSSMKVSQLSTFISRPERFVGMHFFNPVPIMKLCEVIKTDATDKDVFDTAINFILSLGKTPIICKDTTGFVVNRLLTPYLLDAVRAFEAGIASVNDIDVAMKLGCGYPMGPLALIDYVGVDTVHHIAEIMAREFKLPQYQSPPLLKRMVKEGLLGRKSGCGFYSYYEEGAEANDRKLKEILLK